jgi:D-alanine-D-alanine ligase-like ATP-grasp enzyme
MKTTLKTRVAVVYGGRSGEHEISLRSAESVMAVMSPDRYEITSCTGRLAKTAPCRAC